MRDACAVSGVIACTCAACVSLACVDYALLLCLSRRPPPAVSGEKVSCALVYGTRPLLDPAGRTPPPAAAGRRRLCL